MYDQIGEGGLSRDSEAADWASAPALSSAAERAEQEREVRQMLSARSERLVRSGKPALDIDAEIARLLAPQQGRSTTRGSSRRCVNWCRPETNDARARGCEQLDVEEEIQRTLREFGSVSTAAAESGINAPMADPHRYELDELSIRPGTYFNPQTEVLMVVDDSPEVDHEIFGAERVRRRASGC